MLFSFFFFFNDTATTEIYTLSLHDALPIFGRHIIDTWMLAQHYDVATRELETISLKEIARHCGVARADGPAIAADRTSWYFDHDPDTLFRDALDDVREIRALSELL